MSGIPTTRQDGKQAGGQQHAGESPPGNPREPLSVSTGRATCLVAGLTVTDDRFCSVIHLDERISDVVQPLPGIPAQ